MNRSIYNILNLTKCIVPIQRKQQHSVSMKRPRWQHTSTMNNNNNNLHTTISSSTLSNTTITTTPIIHAAFFIDVNWFLSKLDTYALKRYGSDYARNYVVDLTALPSFIERRLAETLGLIPLRFVSGIVDTTTKNNSYTKRLDISGVYCYSSLSTEAPWSIHRAIIEEGFLLRNFDPESLLSTTLSTSSSSSNTIAQANAAFHIALATDMIHTCSIRGNIDTNVALSSIQNNTTNTSIQGRNKLDDLTRTSLIHPSTQVIIAAVGTGVFTPTFARILQHGRTVAIASTRDDWARVALTMPPEQRDVTLPILLDDVFPDIIISAENWKANALPIPEIATRLHKLLLSSTTTDGNTMNTNQNGQTNGSFTNNDGYISLNIATTLAAGKNSGGLLKHMRRAGINWKTLVSDFPHLFSLTQLPGNSSPGGTGGWAIRPLTIPTINNSTIIGNNNSVGNNKITSTQQLQQKQILRQNHVKNTQNRMEGTKSQAQSTISQKGSSSQHIRNNNNSSNNVRVHTESTSTVPISTNLVSVPSLSTIDSEQVDNKNTESMNASWTIVSDESHTVEPVLKSVDDASVLDMNKSSNTSVQVETTATATTDVPISDSKTFTTLDTVIKTSEVQSATPTIETVNITVKATNNEKSTASSLLKSALALGHVDNSTLTRASVSKLLSLANVSTSSKASLPQLIKLLANHVKDIEIALQIPSSVTSTTDITKEKNTGLLESSSTVLKSLLQKAVSSKNITAADIKRSNLLTLLKLAGIKPPRGGASGASLASLRDTVLENSVAIEKSLDNVST